MFTTVYLQTTDPRVPLTAWSYSPVVAAILFHTVLYTAVFNLASFLFLGRPLHHAVNVRLLVALLVIMSVGYLGRFYHVQEIYRAYGNNVEKTRQHCDHVFLTWIFLA
jgi:hypothetical protein